MCLCMASNWRFVGAEIDGLRKYAFRPKRLAVNKRKCGMYVSNQLPCSCSYTCKCPLQGLAQW